MIKSNSTQHGDLLQFNSSGFAAFLNRRRVQLDLSTRELAKLANISQPYVVALERAREVSANPKRKLPTPTVEVIAQLAHALKLDPTTLFEQAMRKAGRHILLLVDAKEPTPMQIVEQAEPNHTHLELKLHKSNSRHYRASDITKALNEQLGTLKSEMVGKSLGLVFSETSNKMTKVNNPQAVINFEHQWANVVTRAADSIGAHALFNICVYKRSDLESLPNPSKTLDELIDCHDEVWSFKNSQLKIEKREQI